MPWQCCEFIAANVRHATAVTRTGHVAIRGHRLHLVLAAHARRLLLAAYMASGAPIGTRRLPDATLSRHHANGAYHEAEYSGHCPGSEEPPCASSGSSSWKPTAAAATGCASWPFALTNFVCPDLLVCLNLEVFDLLASPAGQMFPSLAPRHQCAGTAACLLKNKLVGSQVARYFHNLKLDPFTPARWHVRQASGGNENYDSGALWAQLAAMHLPINPTSAKDPSA